MKKKDVKRLCKQIMSTAITSAMCLTLVLSPMDSLYASAAEGPDNLGTEAVGFTDPSNPAPANQQPDSSQPADSAQQPGTGQAGDTAEQRDNGQQTGTAQPDKGQETGTTQPAQTEKTLVYNGTSCAVVVTYKADAQIPDGATLSVEEPEAAS